VVFAIPEPNCACDDAAGEAAAAGAKLDNRGAGAEEEEEEAGATLWRETGAAAAAGDEGEGTPPAKDMRAASGSSESARERASMAGRGAAADWRADCGAEAGGEEPSRWSIVAIRSSRSCRPLSAAAGFFSAAAVFAPPPPPPHRS
jgi:hypothetical protein